jgi:hypothetical protein
VTEPEQTVAALNRLRSMYVIAAVILSVTIIAAYTVIYATSPAGQKPHLTALLSALPTSLLSLGALFQSKQTATRVDRQVTPALGKITEATNGQLDGRIRDAFTLVLKEHPDILTGSAVAEHLTAMLETAAEPKNAPAPPKPPRKR